ncbi:MAG TPA: folate-binding protein [Hyphomicrobiales bacterium]|nr:folate-binding protein [Hyphomicrobiales bacterium]
MISSAQFLPDRFLIEIAGDDRASFLQGLLTNDVEHLTEGSGRFAGLLSPQGKILFDFFVVNLGGRFIIDCPKKLAPDLTKRLNFYKLRAKVAIAEMNTAWRVAAAWGEGAGEALKDRAAVTYRDPRLGALGYRLFLDPEKGGLTLPATSEPAASEYEAMRIGLGVPEGGKDYAYGETFPHEACFDLLNGVDFKKGCFVGQEVVSRMQHRGTARTRVLCVLANAPLPEAGGAIAADGFTIGQVGSVWGNRGVALVRLDRAREALANGQSLKMGDVAIELKVPSWASYSLDAQPQGAAS